MKKAAPLIGTFLLALTLSVSAQAENQVKNTMKSMGKSFTTAEKADDLATIKKELATLREYALQVQKLVPDHLKEQPTDSADRKLFAEGISAVLEKIEKAQTMANEGKFDETKIALAEIKSTRNQYHKKLKP